MNNDPSVNAKYVFLDVVGFTRNRSVEAQSYLVESLNHIVNNALDEVAIPRSSILFIPTGDGICIAILDTLKPINIHLVLALSILKHIGLHNKQISDQQRQFLVRIGINENVDNYITDINGNQNVAGAGINYAARIMDSAEASQIFVGTTTYETLRHREQYLGAFRPIQRQIKHNLTLNMYQFIDSKNEGLNIQLPSYLQQAPPEKLPRRIAYYLAYSAKNKQSLLRKKENTCFTSASTILLWFLAHDLEEVEDAGDLGTPFIWTYKHNKSTFPEQLEYYMESLDFVVSLELANSIHNFHLYKYYDLFARPPYDGNVFVSEKGLLTLKSDWPEVAKQFGL